jgi:glycosyltransferase involved in cell wall biosynthesis
VVRDMLEGAAGCLAYSPAEARLLRRLAPRARVTLGGVGFAPAGCAPDPDGFCARRGISPGYLLYAGRREEAKGVPTLYTYYAHYVQTHASAPPLALMGAGELPPPPGLEGRVIDLGFVPAVEAPDAMAAAAVLVHPSRLESFGMVVLEAWLQGVPALVNGGSAVLRDHCRAAQGGLWYGSYEEFEAALDLLLGDPGLRTRMGEEGRGYVLREWSWEEVRGRYLEAIARWL